MTKERLEHIMEFYQLMAALEQRLGGTHRLRDCSGKLNWPKRGVHFFMEDGETRSDSGTGLRIVRIGTHALSATSRTTLWNRLSQHRGTARSGGGNHRGSIFRLLVGTALIGRGEHACKSWNNPKGSVPRDVRAAEQPLEQAVSEHIGAMPFLWLEVDDAPGRDSVRGFIERNAIALLSNCDSDSIDQPSGSWLGTQCDRPLVRQSGLWNQNHVQEEYDPAFLRSLERHIEAANAMGRP